MEYSDDKETAVCNLASIGLSKFVKEDKIFDYDKLHEVTKVVAETLDKVIDTEFDLVVTVCDNAMESCPVFPKQTRVIHVGYEDPDGKNYSAFEKTLKLIKMELTPIVRMELGL